MGDLIRRLLYPLVLPFIVLSVWAYAWTMKLDAQFEGYNRPIPMPSSETVASSPARWTPAYGLAGDDDAVASVDDAE